MWRNFEHREWNSTVESGIQPLKVIFHGEIQPLKVEFNR